MIVVALAAIGIGSALWSRPRVRRLAELDIDHVGLVWIALAIQLLLVEGLGDRLPALVADVVHLATFALALAFIVVNRQLPGALLIAAGTTANVVAIVANGGTMPAAAGAWRGAGLPDLDSFGNSAVLPEPRLAVLGDVFHVPAGWPLANVFSVGDVLVVIGATYLAHRWCASPPTVPTERLELSLPRT